MYKTKLEIVFFCKAKEKSTVGDGSSFRERERSFSLDLRPFEPSVLDRARSKAVLRGKGYAWTPIWWSSDNSKR